MVDWSGLEEMAKERGGAFVRVAKLEWELLAETPDPAAAMHLVTEAQERGQVALFVLGDDGGVVALEPGSRVYIRNVQPGDLVIVGPLTDEGGQVVQF